MNRRTLLAAAASVPLLSGCLYPRFFEIEWDEEVQLHDGRVIVVHRKTKCERLSQLFTPYSGVIIPRDTTISFPADLDNPNSGKQITQFVKNGDVLVLDRYKDKWILILFASSLGQYQPERDWGPRQIDGVHAGILVGEKFIPKSLCTFPVKDYRLNFLASDFGKKFLNLDRTRVTLKDKEAWALYNSFRSDRFHPGDLFCKNTANSTTLNNWESTND